MANIEATFPALFGLIIDHCQPLFGSGDERVASLMLWHFAEEIEHRSSALRIYEEVVGSRWYRTRVMRESLSHMGGLFQGVLDDFRTQLPAELVDLLAPTSYTDLGKLARLEGSARRRTGGRRTFRATAGTTPYGCISNRRMMATVGRIMRSQTPLFRPDRERVPIGYTAWMARFAAGHDMTRAYGQPAGAVVDPVAHG